MPQVLTLIVTRDPTSPGGTLGRLEAYVKDALVYWCWTLEDPTRSGVKVYGDTAIPEGTYRVSNTLSARFGKRLPLIWDVQGFKGARLHGGNDKFDTLGCILLGTQLQSPQPHPRIGICAPAVTRITQLIDANDNQATLIVKSKA